jgi:hypothetical protein
MDINDKTYLESVIGYDIDGVLCNPMPMFAKWFLENKGFDPTEYYKNRFKMWCPPSYDPHDFHKDIATATIEGLEYTYPLNDNLEAVRSLSDALGQIPIMITARSERTREATIQWLNYWFHYAYGLVMNGRKGETVQKYKHMKYFVEDRYRNVLYLAPVCHTVFMVRSPWNAGRQLPYPNIIPVDNLWDVKDYVLELEGK